MNSDTGVIRHCDCNVIAVLRRSLDKKPPRNRGAVCFQGHVAVIPGRDGHHIGQARRWRCMMPPADHGAVADKGCVLLGARADSNDVAEAGWWRRYAAVSN